MGYAQQRLERRPDPRPLLHGHRARDDRPEPARSASSSSPQTSRGADHRRAPGRLAQARPDDDLHAQAPRADSQVELLRARRRVATFTRAAAGRGRRRRDDARRPRQLPRRARVQARPSSAASTVDQRRSGSTTTCRASCPPSRPRRGRPRRCKAQAIAARTYAITTAKSADFDHYADTRSQVYKGVGIETAVDQRGRRRHARADRHLPGPAGRHLLLLDLGRAHRVGREHVAGHASRGRG